MSQKPLLVTIDELPEPRRSETRALMGQLMGALAGSATLLDMTLKGGYSYTLPRMSEELEVFLKAIPTLYEFLRGQAGFPPADPAVSAVETMSEHRSTGASGAK